MPSSTAVTQAGSSLFCPLISTRHNRQAPTSESPSISQSRGTKMPFCRATSRILSSWRPVTSRPSILSVLTVATGLMRILLLIADPGGTSMLLNMRAVLLGKRSESADDRVRCRLPQSAEAGVLEQVAELFEHL